VDTTSWIIVAVAAVVVVLAVLVTATVARRRHRRALRERFGPEYDRAVETAGRRRRAERDLDARVGRREELALHALDEPQRQRLRAQWTAVQARFVDDPMGAVGDAERVLDAALAARGYPVDRFEEQVDLVSVDHPEAAEDYRLGHERLERARAGHAGVEDCRQAVLSLRRVFDRVVEAAGTPERVGARDGHGAG
jgi:hypothetical protein